MIFFWLGECRVKNAESAFYRFHSILSHLVSLCLWFPHLARPLYLKYNKLSVAGLILLWLLLLLLKMLLLLLLPLLLQFPLSLLLLFLLLTEFSSDHA